MNAMAITEDGITVTSEIDAESLITAAAMEMKTILRPGRLAKLDAIPMLCYTTGSIKLNSTI